MSRLSLAVIVSICLVVLIVGAAGQPAASVSKNAPQTGVSDGLKTALQTANDYIATLEPRAVATTLPKFAVDAPVVGPRTSFAQSTTETNVRPLVAIKK